MRDILLDMARTWTRLALEAEEWRRDNSPKSRLAKKDATKGPPEGYFPQSSSASRFTAGERKEAKARRQLVALAKDWAQ